MHNNAKYGVASIAYATAIMENARNVAASHILDYGCGKQHLKRLLEPMGFVVHGYDPALPEVAATPSPCEFVACIDVLEHVEPELLPNVLEDLARVTIRHGFYTVGTDPAHRLMPDGTNPHKTIEPIGWWQGQLFKYFKLSEVHQATPGHYCMMVKRK